MTKEDAQRQASDEMGYANGKNYAIPMDKLGEFIDRAMDLYAESEVNKISSNTVLPADATNWKEKYEKCIEVIKRFDAGIIGMYDL